MQSDNRGPQIFRMAGFAGTGKTHVVSRLFRVLHAAGVRVNIMAPTNKAVLTLKARDVPAATVHKTIYEFIGGDFYPRTHLDGDLVVIEEASMVAREDSDIVLSFGKPVLFVGDPLQHAPVGGLPGPIFEPADAMLEEVTRQAAGSPIIQLAYRLRKGLRWGYGKVEHTTAEGVVLGVCIQPLEAPVLWEHLETASLIVCGKHVTRVKLNHQLRQQLFGPDVGPLTINERVVANSTSKQFPAVCKGALATVRAFTKVGQVYHADVEMDTGQIYSLPFRFGDGKGSFGRKSHDTWWDYGYALTSHRVQSTEADDVVVIHDWDNVLSVPELYTPITRAKRYLRLYTNYPKIVWGAAAP
jgi:hypothetical protein